MEAARPPRRRRRPRRGAVDEPLNTQLVRVAFVVVAPAFLALLFSISATGSLPRPSLEPLFDGESAAEFATRLSTEFPVRIPGTVGAEGATRWFTETLASLGFPSEEDVWTEDLADLGDVELRNVVGVIEGRSEETIVLVAHRDNAGADAPYGDNASGTAALIELARGYAPQERAPTPLPQRTIVLVSTDGGAYGGAGARRFVRESDLAKDALAAIVLNGIGGTGPPRLAIGGHRPESPARALVRTASARIQEQAQVTPALPSAPAQLVALGLPHAVGEQGAFLAEGVAAVTITADDPGDPNVPVGDPGGRVSLGKLSGLGRATEALVGSIDGSVGRPFRTPDSIFLGDRAASGRMLRLTLLVAVVPFALGALDLLARARRRGLALLPAARALRARLAFWIYAGLLLWLGGVAGILPTGAALPLPPYSSSVLEAPGSGLAVLVIALGVGWALGSRRLRLREAASPEDQLAGYTVALTWLAGVAVVIALWKPYALLFVLPSLYAWLWLPLRRPPAVQIVLYGVGLAGPVAALAVLAVELGLGPVEVVVYVAGLATVGYLPFVSILLALGWAAAAAQLGALAFGRYGPYAGGAAHPPPGVVRTTVAGLAQSARRGYVRSR